MKKTNVMNKKTILFTWVFFGIVLLGIFFRVGFSDPKPDLWPAPVAADSSHLALVSADTLAPDVLARDSLAVAEPARATPQEGAREGVAPVPAKRTTYSGQGRRGQEAVPQPTHRPTTPPGTSTERGEAIQALDPVSSFRTTDEQGDVIMQSIIDQVVAIQGEVAEARDAAQAALNSLGLAGQRDGQEGDQALIVDIPNCDRYDDWIRYYSRKEQLDPMLFKAIIFVESGCLPRARNPESTATGLTQVIAGTYRAIYPSKAGWSTERIRQALEDPQHAIETGARYLGDFVVPHITGGARGLVGKPFYNRIPYSYYLGHQTIDNMITRGTKPSARLVKQANQYMAKVMRTYERFVAASGFDIAREYPEAFVHP